MYPRISALSVALLLCGLLVLSGCAHPTHANKAAGASPSPGASRVSIGKTKKPRKPAAGKPDREDTSGYVGKTFRVRTTAYTGTKNAISGKLKHGTVTSAATDWAHFPVGTRFRIRETGRVYIIDDYGSALVGTHTVDLAKRNKAEVRKWGVRWVHIDILEWGSPRRSLEILTPRKGYRHIRPMIAALRNQSEGMPVRFRRTEVK